VHRRRRFQHIAQKVKLVLINCLYLLNTLAKKPIRLAKVLGQPLFACIKSIWLETSQAHIAVFFTIIGSSTPQWTKAPSTEAKARPRHFQRVPTCFSSHSFRCLWPNILVALVVFGRSSLFWHLTISATGCRCRWHFNFNLAFSNFRHSSTSFGRKESHCQPLNSGQWP